MHTELGLERLWGHLSTMRAPRVLIAEEDDLIRDRLADALRADGYDVIEAEDGFEVLDCVLALRPGAREQLDVIVADSQMSGYSGLEVLKRLRRLEIDTPFILINHNTEGDVYRDAERLGVDLVVASPLDVDEVCEAVFSLSRG